MVISAQLPSLARCPHHAAPKKPKPAPTGDTFTPIAPDHTWLAKDPVHTPVPNIGSWENAQHFDVVVVGGGMGGLNTAWRLKDSGQKIGIFERTKHLGGRVHTAPAEGNSRPMDVGAMRFIPSQHKLLNNLAEHFQIPTREFIVGGDKNLQFYRGERLTNEQMAKNPAEAPYKLAPQEQVKSADVKWSLDRAIAARGFPAIQMGASQMVSPDQFVVIDEYTIRVDFPQPNKLVLANLAVPVAQIVNSTELKAKLAADGSEPAPPNTPDQ